MMLLLLALGISIPLAAVLGYVLVHFGFRPSEQLLAAQAAQKAKPENEKFQ